MTEQTTAMTASTPNLTCEQQIVVSYFRCLLDFRLKAGIPLIAALADARGDGFDWTRWRHPTNPARKDNQKESDSECSQAERAEDRVDEPTLVESVPKVEQDQDADHTEIPEISPEMIRLLSLESEWRLNIEDLERRVIPLASSLIQRAGDEVMREVLGLQGREQLFIWAAILLYINEKDALLADTYLALETCTADL